MELIWLEDFVALAECENFSRAAQLRHVSQPAFSRRVRAFEDWLGVQLFIRTPHGATLTDAGRHVLASGQEITRRLYQLRTDAREVAGKEKRMLQFSATHSLSFTFFPRWIRSFARGAPLESVRLLTDNMLMCEQMLLQGQVQFLLCHHHPEVPSRLLSKQFSSKIVGEDTMLPLLRSNSDFLIKLAQGRSVPFLNYTEESGLERIVSSELPKISKGLNLEPVFSSHLAAVLLSMVLEDKGIAWLPQTLAEQDINEGTLVRAFGKEFDIPLEIRIYRSNITLSEFSENFWEKA